MPDITMTLTLQLMNRAQSAVGLAMGLKTAGTPAVPPVMDNTKTPPVIITPAVPGVPGVPRDATNAEVKGWMKDQLKNLVQSVERQKALKKAVDDVPAVVAFEPT